MLPRRVVGHTWHSCANDALVEGADVVVRQKIMDWHPATFLDFPIAHLDPFGEGAPATGEVNVGLVIAAAVLVKGAVLI